MKTTKKPLTILVFSLLYFCGIGYGQDPTVTITLFVDTAELGTNNDAPGGCTFKVDPPSAIVTNDPNDPKTFTIKVNDGDTVVWEGITTSDKDVKMKKITYIKGTEIFKSKSIKGETKDGKEKVKAKAIKKTLKDKDFEYLIRFRVDGFGNYKIDPKIQVK